MKSIKSRLFATVAILVASVSCMTGCGKKSDTPAGTASVQKPDGKVRPLLAVSVLTLTNPFFKDMSDAFTSEGAKLGYDVQVTSGETADKQKDQVKDFLVRKATAIVLTPCDSKSIGTAIADANMAGIPVFTADVATTADGVKVVSHCATDNLEGGRIAGRAVVEALGGKGTIAVIDHQEVESGQLREQGFLEEIAKAPGITVAAKLPSGGLRDHANSAAQDILTAHPDVAAIFAINDQTALGALAAVETAGKGSQVRIVGFDGVLEARQAVKNGKIYATVLQSPRKIAEITVDNVGKYMAGETVPPKVLIPPAIYLHADAVKDAELK